MKLHTDDIVVIITGKDKGKIGKILRVLKGSNRLIVEGVNMRTRHIRKTPQRPGHIVRYEAGIHRSNAMFLDPKTRKRTRLRMVTDGRGKTWRQAIRSGEAIDQRRAKVSSDGELKSGGGPTGEEKKEGKETPAREPFWKRAFRRGAQGGEGEQSVRDHQEEVDRSSPGSVRRSRESS